MLVLNRSVDESITLTLPDGRTILVMICDLGRDNVQVGINAPLDVQILRTELFDRHQKGRWRYGKREW